MPLPYPFTLRGNTTQLWSEITNNEWKRMLPKTWTDKGFHFYSRIADRGPDAGISSPSDLETEMRKGTVVPHQGVRYGVVLPILNSEGQHFTVFYDLNARKRQAELVTCSYV